MYRYRHLWTRHVYTGIFTRVHVYRYCNSMPSDKYNTGTGTRVPIPVSTYFQYTCTRTCVLTVQYYIMPCLYGCVPVPGTYTCRYRYTCTHSSMYVPIAIGSMVCQYRYIHVQDACHVNQIPCARSMVPVATITGTGRTKDMNDISRVPVPVSLLSTRSTLPIGLAINATTGAYTCTRVYLSSTQLPELRGYSIVV